MCNSLAVHSLNSDKCTQPHKSQSYQSTEHFRHHTSFLPSHPSQSTPAPARPGQTLLWFLHILVLACSRTSIRESYSTYTFVWGIFFPSAEGLTVEGKRQLTGMWLFFAFFYSHVIWSMGSCGLPVVFMGFCFFLKYLSLFLFFCILYVLEGMWKTWI